MCSWKVQQQKKTWCWRPFFVDVVMISRCFFFDSYKFFVFHFIFLANTFNLWKFYHIFSFICNVVLNESILFVKRQFCLAINFQKVHSILVFYYADLREVILDVKTICNKNLVLDYLFLGFVLSIFLFVVSFFLSIHNFRIFLISPPHIPYANPSGPDLCIATIHHINKGLKL